MKYTIEAGNKYAIVGVLGQTVCNAIDNNTFTSREINLKTSVTINSKTYDVLEVAPYAFFQYKSFQNIILSQKLIKIGQNAFDQGLHSIDVLVIPDSVLYLGNYCFATSNIKILKLGKNINEIGFCICGMNIFLEKIIVDPDNHYFAHDALYNLYSKDYSVLYQVNAIQEHYTTP